MKYSIGNIFKTLHISLLVTLTLAVVSFLFVVEQSYSYAKINTLNTQKTFFTDFVDKKNASEKIDMIIFNSNMATVKNKIRELRRQNSYNYISKIITKTSKNSAKELRNLHVLVNKHHKLLHFYLQRIEDNKTTLNSSEEIDNSTLLLINSINSIITKNTLYDKARFDIFMKIFIVLLISLAIISIWSRQQLKNIYADIVSLSSVETSKDDRDMFTQEVDAIKLKMSKKTSLEDNPDLVDKTTRIYNSKGIVQAYMQNKTSKDKHFTSISILEIDNFSESNRTYSEDFTNEILKKVAYTISLYGGSNDIIARTAYNQFTIILSRSSVQQPFVDIDQIRQSISEIKFVSPQQEAVTITVTGSFINKDKKTSLEDSIKQVSELLKSAKKLGINRIVQTKDLAK